MFLLVKVKIENIYFFKVNFKDNVHFNFAIYFLICMRYSSIPKSKKLECHFSDTKSKTVFVTLSIFYTQAVRDLK